MPETPHSETPHSETPEPDPAPSLEDVTGYTAEGVPTFDHVRSVVEGRSATALGAGELDRDLPEVRTLEQQEIDREAAGRDRLEEIRRAMRGDA